MKPVDYRNQAFEDLEKRGRSGIRGKVYAGYQVHGPCTTRELAERIGICILTVRPRTTELIELHLVACTGRPGPEGTYHALPRPTARLRFQAAQARALKPEQTELPLGV